jgi:hypothetical protein
MAGTYQGQRWMVWVLWKEGVPAGDIHHCLTAVCKDAAQAVQLFFDGFRTSRMGTKVKRSE